MSMNGIKKDIGECNYRKLTICFHQLFMNWDSFLYDNNLKCSDAYFDDMEDWQLDLIRKNSGEKIIA
jgi:hypothetical protein